MSENTTDMQSQSIDSQNIDSQNEKIPFAQNILEFSEMLIFVVLLVLITFTFVARLCTVNGSSMNNTLRHGQAIITSNVMYTPKQGDIVVFHQTGNLNEPVVKRVIATEGQHVKIDFSKNDTMIIWVDGIEYSDDYAYFDPQRANITPKHNYNEETKIFEATVPEGHVFVLGDNRNNSKDSRSLDIGFVDERRIIGRSIFELK